MPSVVEMDACPIQRLTSCTSTPEAKRIEAYVWRRSWKRTPPRRALWSARLKFQRWNDC